MKFPFKKYRFFVRKKRSYIAVQKYKYSTVLQVYNASLERGSELLDARTVAPLATKSIALCLCIPVPQG